MKGITTDLYELTMTAGYFTLGMDFHVTFELSFRHMPPDRGYLVASGIEDALNYITSLQFTDKEINYLQSLEVFKKMLPDFFDYLSNFSFKGDVWAVKEGTVVFKNEPVLQVHASLLEAQMLETYLLNIINFQSIIATKASRIVHAAQGHSVMEFGLRRAHGIEAGLLAAKLSYMAGCIGTSNVLAGYKFGIPVYGTTAHSWIMVFPTEEHSFHNYHSIFPHHTVLLIDTYDVIRGAQLAIKIGKEVKGVRIDSGNLPLLAKKVRKMLDSADMHDTKIILSGDLNEYIIEDLLNKKTPVDLFGVGTDLVTSKDAPALGGIYKLVEEFSSGHSKPCMKSSIQKSTLPGRKQVYRYTKNRKYAYDTIALFIENIAHGTPLLQQYIKHGKRIIPPEDLHTTRNYIASQLPMLSSAQKQIKNPAQYNVKLSKKLKAMINSFSCTIK